MQLPTVPAFTPPATLSTCDAIARAARVCESFAVVLGEASQHLDVTARHLSSTTAGQATDGALDAFTDLRRRLERDIESFMSAHGALSRLHADAEAIAAQSERLTEDLGWFDSLLHHLTGAFSSVTEIAAAHQTAGDLDARACSTTRTFAEADEICAQFIDRLEFGIDESGPDVNDHTWSDDDRAVSRIFDAPLFTLDADGNTTVQWSDVDQGGLGDCSLLATLMSIAESDPEFVVEMITDNHDGTYSVRFYDEDGFPYWVEVEEDLILDESASVRIGPWDVTMKPKYAGVGDALWPAILEKAVAQDAGSYNATTMNPWEAMQRVTGEKPWIDDYEEPSYGRPDGHVERDISLDALAEVIEGGGIVVSSTPPHSGGDGKSFTFSDAGDQVLQYQHADSVQSVDVAAQTVTVQNPWGEKYPAITLTYDEFHDSFVDVQWVPAWN